MKTVHVNLEISDYANRVLGMVKVKYGLRDKAEAFDKFAEMYGPQELEPPVRPEYAEKILRLTDEHIRKHGFKSLSKQEADAFLKE